MRLRVVASMLPKRALPARLPSAAKAAVGQSALSVRTDTRAGAGNPLPAGARLCHTVPTFDASSASQAATRPRAAVAAAGIPATAVGTADVTLPGVEAMMPGSALTRLLHLPQLSTSADLSVICGDVQGKGLFGQLKILDVRAKAKRELGEKFSLKEFHNGAFSLAINTQTPILPVIFPDTVHRWHYSGWWKWWPGPNRAIILPPVPVTDLTLDDLPALKQRLFDIMWEELAKYPYPA